jgi:DNA mismatch repair protein MutS
LKQVPDLERSLSRLSLERGGPRDLGAVRNTLAQSLQIAGLLDAAQDVPSLLTKAYSDLVGHDQLLEELEHNLIADLPLHARDGGFIAPEANPELDEARKLRDEGRSVIAEMQGTYQNMAGVSSLKIKHNNVLGYFVETTATHAEKMLSPPLSDTFIHRQTTANQVRFTTVELSELETRIQNAGDRSLAIERDMFEALRTSIMACAAKLHQLSRALATIDVDVSLATLAVRESWARPLKSRRDVILLLSRL